MPEASLMQKRSALLTQCPPPPAPLSDADIATLPIHVTEWGAAGPPVLIVHGGVQGGLGGGPSTFSRQEALARQGWRLRLVDRPGFGRSPSRGVDDMEADARWIADMLGDGGHLMGHSWGGAEVLLAAARRTAGVQSLVLIEPALQSLLSGDPSVGEDPVLKADAAKMMGLLMSASSPRDYALGFARSLGSMPGQGGAPNAAAEALEADPQRAAGVGCALLQARMASVEAFRQAAETIARAKIPVLVVTGGWSPFFDAVGAVAARATQGRHVIVRAPNHFVQLASADDFNRVVDTFMREAGSVQSKPGGD